MRKRFLIIITLLLILLFAFPLNAKAVTIWKKGSVSYGSYSTGKYYGGTSGANYYNAWCVQPRATAPSRYVDYPQTEISTSTGVGWYLYYMLNAPGDRAAGHEAFVSVLGGQAADYDEGSTTNPAKRDLAYAISHMLLAYKQGDPNYAYGAGQANINYMNSLLNYIDSSWSSSGTYSGNPPSSFHAYVVHTGGSYQDIVYWEQDNEVVPEYGYITVKKRNRDNQLIDGIMFALCADYQTCHDIDPNTFNPDTDCSGLDSVSSSSTGCLQASVTGRGDNAGYPGMAYLGWTSEGAWLPYVSGESTPSLGPGWYYIREVKDMGRDGDPVIYDVDRDLTGEPSMYAMRVTTRGNNILSDEWLLQKNANEWEYPNGYDRDEQGNPPNGLSENAVTDRAKYGALKVVKEITCDSGSSCKSGWQFEVYQGSTLLTTLTTGSDGSTSVYGIDANGKYSLLPGVTYTIKEKVDSDGFAVNTNSTLNKKWKPASTSQSVTIARNETGKVKSVSYSNNRVKYCLKVKKTDAESGTAINSATFQLSNGQSCTTSGGVCTFSNLDYADYTVTETVAPANYCIDSPAYINVSKARLTPMSGSSCPADTTENVKTDHKKYYCIKVKKTDFVTGELIKDASFKTTIGGNEVEHADNWDGASDGYTTFFTETQSGTFNVVETIAPVGYEKYSGTLQATAKQMTCGKSKSDAEAECKTADPSTFPSTSLPTYPEKKLFLNWYKVTENGSTRANGAKFKVKQKNGNQYIKVNGTQQVKDASNPGITKTCYVFDSLVSEANASTLESMNTGSADGEVCILKVAKGDYTVIETKPAKYHTFGSVITKDLTTSTTFKAMDDSNKFINLKTRFEFDKSVSSGDSDFWSTITTEQLKHIPFNVYDTRGVKISFVKDSNGVYQYAGNTIDGPGSTAEINDLYLNDSRKLVIEHLPEGTYSIKEKGSADGSCSCVDDSGACVGFYYPKYEQESDYKFTITDCSNESANASVCPTHKATTQALQNVPTEIQFTKSDFYGYEDASDVVDFEDEQERNDFDKIVFKLKDQNGNYMRLIKVGNHGTCLTDDSYAEYRYVSEEYINLLPAEERAKLTEELHTCGGHIRVTHLCRNKKYYIEEVSVPENSVFTLPENPADRTREYNIPCCGDTTTPPTSKTVILDKGTRVRFEKRDSKYNYLIPDETTTFQVYQCKKGTECNPADSSNPLEAPNVRKLMKFAPRAVITGDEEDPTDAEGLAGVEVYNAMSDSDVRAGKTNVTDLHPYKGILVLRYLPAGYNYVLLETTAPKNYTLPKGRDAQTKFTVVNNTVNVDEVDMPNVPTSLLIRKYSDDGKLLKGAQFKIYEGTTCDASLSPMNQPKTELKLKTIRDGVYEARPETDTNIIQTCDDDNGVCSSIPLDQVTKLTYTDYLGTWADFANVVNDQNEKIQLAEGEALVQYLEYNHCYIIEEVKAPNGYSLPKKNEDRFTMITIEENEKYAKDTYKTLVNTPTPFTFYKYDEYNNLIDGAEFKLQKLDDNKKYHDLTVTKEEKDGEFYYRVDPNSTNKTITTKGGKATVYYLEEGQYRILETKAAPGKELSKNANVATFFVDDSGNVYGNAIISNKAKTIGIKPSSSAEFIIGPRTGVTVIKYGLIMAILVAVISGLMILQRKKK